MPKQQLDTALIHAGEPAERECATMPIHRSTVWTVAEGGSYSDIRYPRLNNLPLHRVLGAKLAAIEGAEAAVVTSSGMSAISTALLTALGAGGHLLAQDCIYGGTLAFLEREFPRLGLTFDVLPGANPQKWASAVRPNTRAIYVEALTNPLQQVLDHRAVIEFARAHRLLALIDSTFASPVNFQPVPFGYDLSLHSATKYLNGHSDLVAGAVIGRAELVADVVHRLNLFGGSLDPEGCYLLYRGLRTLGLRVERQNVNALEVAAFLEAHPAVERVHYPGLPSHPDHARAAELLRGFGGMLSFELVGGLPATRRFLDAVRLPFIGPSLGGVETLMTLPSRTSHASLTQAQREAMGIREHLVRMSVGIESPVDLIADIEQALAVAAGAERTASTAAGAGGAP